MPTLALDLNAIMTPDEERVALKLQVAAMCRQHEEYQRLLDNPTIKDLFERGALKLKHGCE